MEDVGSIEVDMYAVNILAVGIATRMTALVDDKTSSAGLRSQVGKGGTEEAGSHDEIVVWLHIRNKVSLAADTSVCGPNAHARHH